MQTFDIVSNRKTFSNEVTKSEFNDKPVGFKLQLARFK